MPDPNLQPDQSAEDDRGGAVVLVGRTGIGQPVEVRKVGSWLEVRYRDADHESRGFALNPKYAKDLALGLCAALINEEER